MSVPSAFARSIATTTFAAIIIAAVVLTATIAVALVEVRAFFFACGRVHIQPF